ncbi:unnamed protein product, partial [marine sediment metagenome]
HSEYTPSFEQKAFYAFYLAILIIFDLVGVIILVF